MTFSIEILSVLKKNYAIAKKRSEDFPEGHSERDINAWYAEDVERVIETIEDDASFNDKINVLLFIKEDTPFELLKFQIDDLIRLAKIQSAASSFELPKKKTIKIKQKGKTRRVPKRI